MQNASVRCDRLVEILLVFDSQCDNEVNIEVTLTKLQIGLRNLGAVRGDEDTNNVVLHLIAQAVSLVLVQGNDEIAQAIDVILECFAWLQEINGWRNNTAEYGRGVLVELVEHERQAQCCGQCVNGWVGTDSNQNIR